MSKTSSWAVLVLFLLSSLACSHQAPLPPRTAASPEVRQLDAGMTANVFVVMGERPILVDTGWPGSPPRLERVLVEMGVKPRDLALIVITHGHADHAGGAVRLREISGAKVLAGSADLPPLQAGHNGPMKPLGTLARLIRSSVDKPFPALTPDITISEPFDLRPYGIAGTVLPMPGHTPGSLVVQLDSGDAIVGDMVRGIIGRARTPTRHYFHEDCRAAEGHVAPLIQSGSRRFYAGHGGPFDAQAVSAALSAAPCPKQRP